MADGKWHMARFGLAVRELRLPSAICHLPFALTEAFHS
jgi:hypothetical protein